MTARVMRRFRTIIGLVLLLGGVAARADEFTFSWHEATGSGSANVFDGGPVVFGAGHTGNTMDPTMSFLAFDLTRPGSFGASAAAIGSSEIIDLDEDVFGAEGIRILVNFQASYFSSLFDGGDRPGGMAEGELFSTIEFLMPADEIVWAYQLLINDTIDFTGSTSVVVENVTQSETLLTLTEQVFAVETTLSGDTGDLIRITSQMSGSGSTPGGIFAIQEYEADLTMTFLVPEPSTLCLLLFGALALIKRPLLRSRL